MKQPRVDRRQPADEAMVGDPIVTDHEEHDEEGQDVRPQVLELVDQLASSCGRQSRVGTAMPTTTNVIEMA